MSRRTFIKKEDRPEIKLDKKVSELSVKELVTVIEDMELKSIIHEKNISRDVKPIKEFKQEKPELKSEIKEFKEVKEFKEKPEKEIYEYEKRLEFDPGIIERLPEIEERIERLSQELEMLKNKIG
ncbi:hypothetical protein GF319_13330 [Candidatus Bathyarchaeota archaeon]|jgi:hypothetical protein|nr:hypothetical protein [Candidatus Bathyarchaeota archaeon]